MGDRFQDVGSGAGQAPAVDAGSPAPEAMDPDPLGAVDAAFDRVDAALDTLMGALAAVESTPAGALAWSADRARGLASRAAVVTNRAARVRSRVVSVVGSARQDGGLHHLDDAQLVAGAGHREKGEARRDQALANALGNSAPTPTPGAGAGAGRGEDGDRAGRHGVATGGTDTAPVPRFPVLAGACDTGRVGERQAAIVIEQLQALPGDLTGTQRARAEEVLTDWAAVMSPSRLRRRAPRVLDELGITPAVADAYEDDQVAAGERAAWENTRLWMVDNHDGTWSGRFTLPEVQAHMLKKALDALTSPTRRTTPGGLSAPAGRTTPGGRGDGPHGATHRTNPANAATGQGVNGGADPRHDRAWWDQARGRALCELIDHLPADHLTTRTNAILIVRTDLDTLRGLTDRAGLTDTGAVVSAGQVRRMAATAGLVPAVLGTDSVVLDLGRQTRCFTGSQRTALAASYETCAAADCDRPLAWTQIHHAHPWHPVTAPDGTVLHPGGGPTDLANAIPLCGPHHRQLDDPRLGHTIHTHPDGTRTITYHPRRPGQPWRTDTPPR
ncbi:HNH endonuclease signature motif containing protein, partial [Kytococcus schroeteri]|uniref:HNH endonuclease signature motif containing protein n=1 Tax=Kytococcus schroeteri TaxID=138300 RepID=UPI0011817E36